MANKKKVIKKTTTVVEEVVQTDNLTEIVAILDRSGSMQSIIDDAIGGFNTFLKDQKKEDIPAKMTLALFDDQYELVYDNVELNDVEKMTNKVWSPRGLTALYDAIGMTVNKVADRHKKMKKEERPNKVLVAIVTDGMENASSEFTNESIKKLTKKMEKKDWQFIYLASNQDAFNVGTSFGVKGGNTFTYANTSVGNQVMFSALSNATIKYRTVTTDSANYQNISANLMVDADSEDDTEG